MQKTALVLQPLPANDVPPAPPTPTNEMLMAELKDGQRGAFWTLYWRHADLVRDVIGRVISDEDEREDVLREVFERIRDRAEHYTPEMGKALFWILTLARRCAMERARAAAAAPRTNANGDRPVVLAIPAIAPALEQAAA